MSEAPDNRRIEVGAAGLSRRALGGAAGGAMLAALGLSPASAARNRKRKTAGRQRLQQAEYVFDLAWGDTGDEAGEFRDPRAITVFPETGDVFVADSGNNRVQKFTGEGTFLTQWGSYGRRTGQFSEPNGIAFDPSGAIYVADSENERIQKFTGDGAFVTAWGRPGRGNGEFSEPYGISAGTNGAIYVTDVGLNRIQLFTNTGTFFGAFPGREGDEPGHFDSPTGIAANPLFDEVFVADFKNHRIQVFDAEGRFRRQWGIRGDGNGQLDNPFGVVVDQTSRVLVTDFDNHRVQVFTVEGEFITAFGSKGNDPGEFDHPTGIAVDIDSNVYVADTGNNRIQKFAPV